MNPANPSRRSANAALAADLIARAARAQLRRLRECDVTANDVFDESAASESGALPPVSVRARARAVARRLRASEELVLERLADMTDTTPR